MGGWHDHVTLKVRLGFGSGPLAAAPTFSSNLADDVRDVTIDRGRSSVHDTFDAGVATVTLDNRTGDYDPNNASSPHDPNLLLGTPASIQVVHSGTTFDLFRGHISRWPLDYPDLASDAVAVLELTENSAVLRTSLIQATTYAEEDSAVRIGNILDDVSWPAGARNLEAGAADTAATSFTGESRDLIDEATEAEQGQFFIAKNGDATLLNRTTFSGSTSQATFGPTSTDFDYTDIRVLYDDDLLINKAAITGSTGDTQIASDSTSISNHGEHGVETSNLSILGEPGALNVAENLVIRNRDVMSRVTEFTIEPQSSTALWPEIAGRELQDFITVKVDPPGGGTTLDQDVAVEGIRHEIVGGHWRTTYACHPLSSLELSTNIWILGTGQLDTTTVLA
jgi:hypothetical protein